VTAADASVAVSGIDSKLLGTLARPDGTVQLTLAGWPLYRYAKDANPGDTKGQGVGGTWYASTPAGKKAAAKKATPAKPAGKVLLRVVTDPKLGKIVVDGAGRTLYRFDKDVPKPAGKAVSNCLGACAKAWPPVLWTKGFKVVGLDRALVTNIMRKDGKCQIALNGWPLYRYTKDTAAGQTKGQGVGGIWFVSNPTGKKAVAAKPAASSGGSDSGGDSDYGSGSGY
jgi:predicted lipoprotein with Yx(FWY)xxD motif